MATRRNRPERRLGRLAPPLRALGSVPLAPCASRRRPSARMVRGGPRATRGARRLRGPFGPVRGYVRPFAVDRRVGRGRRDPRRYPTARVDGHAARGRPCCATVWAEEASEGPRARGARRAASAITVITRLCGSRKSASSFLGKVRAVLAFSKSACLLGGDRFWKCSPSRPSRLFRKTEGLH